MHTLAVEHAVGKSVEQAWFIDIEAAGVVSGMEIAQREVEFHMFSASNAQNVAHHPPNALLFVARQGEIDLSTVGKSGVCIACPQSATMGGVIDEGGFLGVVLLAHLQLVAGGDSKGALMPRGLHQLVVGVGRG